MYIFTEKAQSAMHVVFQEKQKLTQDFVFFILVFIAHHTGYT